MDFKKIHKLITDATTVAVTSHYRPDGDSVGSALALQLALLQAGKKVDVYVDDEIPEKLTYMKGVDAVIRPSDIQENAEYDLLIILDASSEDRIGLSSTLRAISKKVICIDHHKHNLIEANEKIVDTASASTGEILYTYFVENKTEITKDIAEALYTSIATDTGCFVHPNTTARTHAVAAELMKVGIDDDQINYINFKVYERGAIHGIAYIFDNIKFYADGKVATVFIPYKYMKKYGLKTQADRLKNLASDVSGVKAGAFITEEVKGFFHVSLRSNGDTDVTPVAVHFSGGGHRNASGFTFKGKYRELEKRVVAQLEKIV